jgi:hypothetical protein
MGDLNWIQTIPYRAKVIGSYYTLPKPKENKLGRFCLHGVPSNEKKAPVSSFLGYRI